MRHIFAITKIIFKEHTLLMSSKKASADTAAP